MRYLALILLLLICSCRSAKPQPDPYTPAITKLKIDLSDITLTDSVRQEKTDSLTALIQVQTIISALPKKMKGKSVLNLNVQIASSGSTIGANSQSGPDNNKTKGSAVSKAVTTNTGGQGSSVSGNAEAVSTQPTQNGISWWWLVGIGLVAALFLANRLIRGRWFI